MHTIQQVRSKLLQQAVLPLYYHEDKNTCLNILHALYQAGIRMIEFTNRGPNAAFNFKFLIENRNQHYQDLILGVGTIKTIEDAKKYLQAGADFLVSPVFNAAVCDEAYLQKVCWIPGCFTPTEIHQANEAGCTMIKLFPGNILTPAFIQSVKPLFPNVDFLVTGGVDTSTQNIQSWFKAGASAIGLGSQLISSSIVANNSYKVLEDQTRNVLKIIASQQINSSCKPLQ